MNKTIVVFHSADFDGLFCREIARKFLTEAQLIGWDFADKPLAIPDGQIYVLDLPVDRVFGFDYAKLDGGGDFKNRVIWIDHHKSSIESHPKDIPGYRIDGVAACRLAWQWFSNSFNAYGKQQNFGEPSFISGLTKDHFVKRMVEEPLAVRLAGEYDIWDKRDPDAELFQHGLRSCDLADRWPRLLGEDSLDARICVNTLLKNGECLQYAKAKENESIIQHQSFRMKWEGLNWLCCNHARFNSFLFTAGLMDDDQACLGFCWDGRKWKVSLYHAPGEEHHDLSLIAVKHGGGGHRGACGFTCKELPFKLL